jgi:excisionase family DNA binding protein
MPKKTRKKAGLKKATAPEMTLDVTERPLQPPTVTFRIPEVAKILGISRSFAYQLVQREELPSVTFSKKAIRVLKSDLVEYIKTHRNYLDDITLRKEEREREQAAQE